MIVKTTIIKGMDSFFSDENSIGRSNISHSKIKATTSPKISENKKGGALKKTVPEALSHIHILPGLKTEQPIVQRQSIQTIHIFLKKIQGAMK